MIVINHGSYDGCEASHMTNGGYSIWLFRSYEVSLPVKKYHPKKIIIQWIYDNNWATCYMLHATTQSGVVYGKYRYLRMKSR